MSRRAQRLALVVFCLLLGGLGLAVLHRVHELNAINAQTEQELHDFTIVPASAVGADDAG